MLDDARFSIIGFDDYYSCGKPSIVSLCSYDFILVSTLTLDACYVLLYFAYLLLNMSLTLFLDVQTPQVSNTMRSRRVRRSQRISNQLRRSESGVPMT